MVFNLKYSNKKLNTSTHSLQALCARRTNNVRELSLSKDDIQPLKLKKPKMIQSLKLKLKTSVHVLQALCARRTNNVRELSLSKDDIQSLKLKKPKLKTVFLVLQALCARRTNNVRELNLPKDFPALKSLMPSPVIIPMLSAFETLAALQPHRREGELDSPVTISGMADQVCFKPSCTDVSP